jgi:transcriptional regulator with GAF, ATPase, and Fis domain
MMGLRFLNIKEHVEEQYSFSFIDDFKGVLEQLGLVTNIFELKHITQSFFEAAFDLPKSRVRVLLRKTDKSEDMHDEFIAHDIKQIENFINLDLYGSISKHLRQEKIYIRDELEFTHFYDSQERIGAILQFLSAIDADVFIPIYEKQSIIGCIIIEHNARPGHLYNTTERDEMVIYASYLGNIINLLLNRTLDSLIAQEKELNEELFNKHQELNHLKESMNSLLQRNDERVYGLIYYKSKKFSAGNQATQELLGYDVSTDADNRVQRIVRKMVKQVIEYKTSQVLYTENLEGKRLKLTALLSPDTHHVLVLCETPTFNEHIAPLVRSLKNPSDWDYLLYLETTPSGQLINQLIPSNTKTTLDFKINLLKIALNKKATLLQLPEEDTIPTVELIHHINLRKKLEILSINDPEKNQTWAIKLFGVNPLLSDEQHESILERLHTSGTLFINNIHNLSLETQELLAEYLRTGHFKVLRSDRKITAQVHFMCSSSKNLAQLVDKKQFSAALYNQLAPMTLSLPALLTLPEDEITLLAEQYAQQAIKSKALTPLFDLTDKDKHYLLEQRPVSLHALKELVLEIVQHKGQHTKAATNDLFDPAYGVTDPKVVAAIRLGKHALKDQQSLCILWQTFKSQTKIATLLGVNRSSVNRRCREYNLIEDEET